MISVSIPRSYWPEFFRTYMQVPICAENCTDFLFTAFHWWVLSAFLIPLMYKATFHFIPIARALSRPRDLRSGLPQTSTFSICPVLYIRNKLLNILLWSLLEPRKPQLIPLFLIHSFIHSHRKYYVSTMTSCTSICAGYTDSIGQQRHLWSLQTACFI